MGDPIGLWLAGGTGALTGLDGYIPQSEKFATIVSSLGESVQPTGEATLHTHLEQLAIHLPRKSIVIVVSDWMEEL